MSRLLASLVSIVSGAAVVAACSASSPQGTTLEDDAGSPGLPEAGTRFDSGITDAVPDGGSGPKCGNSKVEAGEACDDGNVKSDDGCNSSCALESAFEGDACPGKALAFVAGAPGTLHATTTGTTKGAYNHYGSACGGGSGADVVYTFTPASSGKAVVKLTAQFSAILSARSKCDDAKSEIKCADVPSAEGGGTTMEMPVFAGAPVSIVVDGYGGSSGTFTLDVDVSNAVCGNGVAELPEACDDGNKTAGDGCSPTCALEELGVLDTCPGQPFQLSGPAGAARKISFAGNTATQGSATQSGAPGYFTGGKNTVYAVKSDIAGSVKAELLAGYAKSSLHARSDCGDDAYQIGSASTAPPGTSALQFPVAAGQWFYLFVDGRGGSTKSVGGPYSLTVSIAPAACGNHVLDGDEQCDDGNAASGDGCSAACILEPLAGLDTCPGHAVTLPQQADGSRAAVVSGTTTGLTNAVKSCQSLLGASAPDAIFAVTPDIDGLLKLDLSGPFNSTVSVLDSCAAPVGDRSAVLACSYVAWIPYPFSEDDPYVLDGTGSGAKSAGAPVLANHTYYVVVDGSTTSGSPSAGPFELRMRLTAPSCGNGVIEGAETCDDGATDGNDGCSATCQLEPTGPRNTCASADDVTFAEAAPGTWSAAIKSGTTNLTATQNFGSSESQAGACWARGPDAFFKVTAPAAGVLRAKATSSAFDVILGLRQPACATATAPAACSNDGPKGVDESVTTTVAAGDVLYLVVDTPLLSVTGCEKDPYSPTFAADCAKLEERGRFTLDVTVSPSGCGDGFFVPTPAEECDDGNAVSGDGCSVTCKLEAKAGADTCPGTPLALTGAGTAPRKGTITMSTATLSANYVGACGGSSKDGVVRVTAPIDGTLTAKIRNMLGATVYARAVCIDPSTEFLKTSGSTCPNVVHDVVTFQVTAGTDYFLFVDGLESATGVPTLDVTVTP